MKLLLALTLLTTAVATPTPTSSTSTNAAQVLTHDTPTTTGTCIVDATLTGYCHTTLYGNETCAQDSPSKATGNTSYGYDDVNYATC
ncbi:uncharacterized protein PAC_10862 [Phialocephala subalpina]|uniref:Uncharacterized protein n=1 Tax=Phialocephala subalpina TaxID=576137 RepID=A0A1L7X7H7_9HELO|nr:uncharacterized protein PAC_10862 [Phialocephala subalpina]